MAQCRSCRKRSCGALSSLGFNGADCACHNSCSSCNGSYCNTNSYARTSCLCNSACAHNNCGCNNCTAGLINYDCNTGSNGYGRRASCRSDDVYYTGECAPSANCKPACSCGCENGRSGCSGGCHHSCHGESAVSSGAFTALCPLSVSFGGCVPLEMEYGDGDCFRVTEGGIMILRSGEYQVNYSLNVPECARASGCLGVSLDSGNIFHSRAALDARPGDGNSRYTGHCVFTARRGQIMNLVATEGLDIPFSGGAYPAVSLNIVRLGSALYTT